MRRAREVVAAACVTALLACSGKSQPAPSKPAEQPILADRGLRGPTSFEHITDDTERAQALFQEMGKVILHPRCVNCHPDGDRPLQGEQGLPHQPLVDRGGEKGEGAVAMKCTNCHGESNFQNVPGNPRWHLAPLEMAWQGKTLSQICQQISDPARNGGKTKEEIVRHMAEDELVAYGWNPPDHLEPVPGNQALFGQLSRAWLAAGAHCPGT